MILNKKLEKRYYTDLDDISVWRWTQLQETNDYSYLCRKNYKPDAKAVGLYLHLLYQFDELNLDNLRRRKEMVLEILELIQSIDVTQMTIEEIAPLNIFLRALIINPLSVDIDTLIKFVKNSDVRVSLSFLKLNQVNLKNENKHETISIHRRVAQVTRIIPVTIDIKKMSIAQFVAYENEALKIIRDGSRKSNTI